MIRTRWLLLLLLLCCSCSGASRLTPQAPRIRAAGALAYRNIGIYFPRATFENRLLASVDGKALNAQEVNAEEAIRETIVNALKAVSGNVLVLDTTQTFATMKRQDLDAYFWLKDATIRSTLDREGTLFPSYTSYSSVSIKLMRMSGFRGTVDSLTLYGNGSYYAHGIGAGRSRIAQIGAEIALRDLADRIVRSLNVTIR